MKKINQKGFTLIEVLAVIAIIAIIGLISVPSILRTIDTGKEKSYQIMLEDIKTASISLYEEVEFGGSTLYTKDKEQIEITNNKITTDLQSLVSNGFLNGSSQNNKKVLLDPRDNKDISNCQITITKNKDSNNKVVYEIKNASDKSDCEDLSW